jgi:hypothetical protein
MAFDGAYAGFQFLTTQYLEDVARWWPIDTVRA